jgi:hypothetical protein
MRYEVKLGDIKVDRFVLRLAQALNHLPGNRVMSARGYAMPDMGGVVTYPVSRQNTDLP